MSEQLLLRASAARSTKLRVQVALRIDLIDQGRRAPRRRPSRPARRVARRLRRGRAGAARLQLGADRTQRGQRGLMRAHALAVERGQRRDGSIRAAHLAHVVDAQEQAQVAAAARACRVPRGAARGPASHLPARCSSGRDAPSCRPGPAVAAASADSASFWSSARMSRSTSSPAQLDEERLLARRELVGLLAQRAQPLVDAHLLVGGGCRPAAWSEATSIDATIAAASASARAQDIAHNRAIKGRNRAIVHSCIRHPVLPFLRARGGHRLRGTASGAGGERRQPHARAAARDAARDAPGRRRHTGRRGGARCGRAKLERDDDPVDTLVVGLPRRLDGSPNDQTPKVEQLRRGAARGDHADRRGAGRAAHQP